MVTTTTSTTTATTSTESTTATTEPSSIGIAGLPDSVGLPSSPEALIFYLETVADQIRYYEFFLAPTVVLGYRRYRTLDLCLSVCLGAITCRGLLPMI